MKKILFYGASVTAQTGMTGYFDFVKDALCSLEYEALKTAYGGCHIDDAGFYRFESALIDDLKYIVFEWNTTGLNIYNELKFSYIFQVLKSRGINPIFIILPQEATMKGNRNSENQIYSICNRFGIPLLDVRVGLSVDDFTGMVRDVVHTNEMGARFYSNKIIDFLKSVFASENKYWHGFNSYESDALDFINPKVVGMELTLKVGEILQINIKSFSNVYSEIIIRHRIGPFSPVALISDGAVSRNLSFWDPYCHYEREHFSILMNNTDFKHSHLRSPLFYNISISNDLPKYDLCRRENINFDVEKLIKINEFYSLGVDFDLTVVKGDR
jgi:hypothetical protein